MHLLLVESELSGQYFQQRLTAEGFETTLASGEADAKRRIMAEEMDLLLLRGALDEPAGRAILEFARQHRPELPVIVIGAGEDAAQRLAALRTGASDYLAEPFAFAELTARIKAQVRRAAWRDA